MDVKKSKTMTLMSFRPMWHKDKVLVCLDDIDQIIPVGTKNFYCYIVRMKNGKRYLTAAREINNSELFEDK